MGGGGGGASPEDLGGGRDGMGPEGGLCKEARPGAGLCADGKGPVKREGLMTEERGDNMRIQVLEKVRRNRTQSTRGKIGL